MAQSGKVVVLKVGNGATSEMFTTLQGQQQTVMDGSTQVADTTDKSNNGWQTGMVTTIGGNINCNGIAMWDAQLERLRSQWEAQLPVNCELIINSDGDKYSGSFYITQFNIDGNVTDAVKYAISLQAAAALTFTAAT
jgi:predicted secreted protein